MNHFVKNLCLAMLIALCIISTAVNGCGNKSGSTSGENKKESVSEETKDKESGTKEEIAMDRLVAVLGDRLETGVAILSDGEGNINEQPCWRFSLGKNTAEKFTAEEHYAVTDDGTVFLYEVIGDTYTVYSSNGKPKIPLVKIDTRGMEEIAINTDYRLDDLLHISLESYPPTGIDKNYDEKTIVERIKSLEEGENIKIENVVFSGMPNKDYSGGLGYATWTVTYEAGENKDTRYCKDLYFKTNFGEYRVQASVPVKAKQKYLREIDRRFAEAVLASPLTMDITGMREHTPDCEYVLDCTDGTIYVTMQSFPCDYNNNINKKTLPARIKELNRGYPIRNVVVKEYENNLSYPAHIITYETGANEDTSFCTDLYFQTDSNDHWVQMSVSTHENPATFNDEIMKRLATVALDCHYTDMRYE